MAEAQHVAVFIVVSIPDEGERIANALVEERLAACVNRVDNVRSVFRWQGKVEHETESMLVAKTRRALVERLTARVKELHGYTVPEVIAVPILDGNADYLEWISAETEPS